MKELILGPVPENYDPDRHIAASPACFVGREYIYPQFEDLDYVSILDNKDSLKEYDILTTQAALGLVNKVAKIYNPQDFSKYSFRFWKTIYFPWLGAVMAWLYRKQLLSRLLIQKYGDEKINVQLIECEISLSIENEVNFIIDAIWNPELNAWLLSRFIESNMPSRWSADKKKTDINSDRETINRFNRKPSLKEKLYNKLSSYFYRSNGVYGFRIADKVLFHALLSIKPSIFKNTEHSFKKEYNEIELDTDIFKIIDILIPLSLKNCIHETGQRKYKKGKLINYSNKLFNNSHLKSDAAFALHNKELIIATQHGGHNYGSACTFEYGKEIEQKADYFISWGSNTQSNNENTVVLPSPLLSRILNKHKEADNSILLVGTDMRAFAARFDSAPNELDFLNYRKSKSIFLDHLDQSLLAGNIRYRPYPFKKTSYLDADYLMNKFQGLNIHKGNLHKDMQACRLLVLDHPGTTWNIAMAMNTPMILFWKSNHFPFNEEASGFLDKFHALGIYFEDPAMAAKRVNQLLQDEASIMSWWKQDEIQSLRNEWMHKYAKGDKQWRWKWIKRLWKLR